MLDLHYTRTIVLNVEVENWKSHRKENPCTTTPRHSALSSGVFSSSRGLLLFPLYKSWMSLGQTGSCFLNVTVPLRGAPLWPSSAPDAVQMPWWSLFSPSPPTHNPRQLLISGKHLAKVAAREEVGGINLQEKQSHILTPRSFFFFFCLFCHCESCSETTLYLFFSSLFRRSGGIDCARIFACSRDWGRQCPVLTEDSRGHYRKSLKAWVCAKGLTKLEGSFQTYQALCVCVHVCSYLETDGLPADWDSKRGLAGDDNTRPGRRGFFWGGGRVRDLSAKTKQKF